MSVFLWLGFMGLATLSALPLARLDLFSVNEKYRLFKYLSILIFFWTVLTGIKYLSGNMKVVYYATLSVYPLLFLITVVLFLAIMKFLGKKVSKYIIVLFPIFFLVDLTMAYTNDFHQLVLELKYSSGLTYQMISTANHGVFFLIHTAVCYILLIYSAVSILNRLYGNMQKDKDFFPFFIIAAGIFLGIIANIIHLFFIRFKLDPTYVTLVVIASLLYFVFYIRDIRLLMRASGNEFVLDNLREMYLLVNQRGEIVSASSELKDRFNIRVDENENFEDFKQKISDKVIIYKDGKELESNYYKDRLYFHMMVKDINLPLMKRTAKFYLFYDETQNQKYINDLNYVMTHDLMTKIYNRNYFEKIESQIEKNNQNYTLIMFDLDGLKLFNDYLGHEAGDQLLVRFADSLKTVVSKYEGLIPIRMGGDEFLLIALNKDKNDIEEILYDLKVKTTSNDLLKHVGFSYGYASNNLETDAFKRVLREADANQYAMKLTRKEQKEKLEKHLKVNARM